MHKGIPLVFTRVVFISDSVSYVTLKGVFCDNTLLNVHALAENESKVMDNLYEEIDLVFNQIPKYYRKILERNFNEM
jgi:hypothetical protein